MFEIHFFLKSYTNFKVPKNDPERLKKWLSIFQRYTSLMMDQECAQIPSKVGVIGLLERKKHKKLMVINTYPQLYMTPGLSFCLISKLAIN